MDNRFLIIAAMAVMLVGCEVEVAKKVTPMEKEIKTDVIEKTEVPEKEVVVKEVKASPPQVKTPVVPSQPEKNVELSSEELKTLFLTAREVQWKIFDQEPYSINQITEIYSSHFTKDFINRFITERMTPIKINGESKYHVPGSDDSHLILWEGVITFTEETDVKYYEENGVEFINISEYQYDNIMEGNHLVTIVFLKVDGKYKLNDIKREWD